MTSEENTSTEVVRAILRSFADKVRAMSALQLLWVSVLIFFVTAGNAMQTIGLNFWLRKFPSTPGSFTVLTTSAFLFGAFFAVLLVGYIIVKRPCLKFFWHFNGIMLLLGVGLMDAVNSAMAIYAATDTPELLQPLFSSLMPLYACVFSKYILKDQRTYFNRWIVSSFLLMALSVVVASINEFTDGWSTPGVSGSNAKWWSLIFFLSIPPTSLMNVWQTKYMIDYTKKREHEDLEQPGVEVAHVQRVTAGDEVCEKPEHHHHHNSKSNPHHSGSSGIVHRGEDTIVKLVLLCADTNSQLLFIMMLLPADAIPWWGQSDTVPDAWSNFVSGLSCLFTCSENFLFCMVYSAGFVFTYVGSAYLNHYSPTLCGMIGQLSSPVTALLLVLIPSWNLNPGQTPWYLSVIAIVLLSVGTLIYGMWEEMTSSMAPDAAEGDDDDEAKEAVMGMNEANGEVKPLLG